MVCSRILGVVFPAEGTEAVSTLYSKEPKPTCGPIPPSGFLIGSQTIPDMFNNSPIADPIPAYLRGFLWSIQDVIKRKQKEICQDMVDDSYYLKNCLFVVPQSAEKCTYSQRNETPANERSLCTGLPYQCW